MDGKRLIKKLSEENNELKQYIETLNKECMELQAALFEEANKMVGFFNCFIFFRLKLLMQLNMLLINVLMNVAKKTQ